MSSRSRSAPPQSSAYDDEEDFSEMSSGGHRGANQAGRRMLAAILSRWYWLALGLVLGGLGSVYYLSKATKIYAATSTLAITVPTGSVMNSRPEQVDEFDTRTVEGLNTIAALIGRQELLVKVASRADVRSLKGVKPQPVVWTPEWLSEWLGQSQPGAVKSNPDQMPEPDDLAGWIGSWLKISVRPKTRLLDITIRHPVPEVAKVLADGVAREYVAELADKSSKGQAAKSGILLKQSEEFRASIQADRQAQNSYVRVLELHRVLEAQEAAVGQLARRYLPKHPRMAAALGELNGTKVRFIEELKVAMASSADADYWKKEGGKVEAAKGDAEKQLQVARQLLLARAGTLEGEIRSQEKVLDAMVTNRSISDVDREGASTSVDIKSFAQLPEVPAEPSSTKVLALGVGGGLALGLLLALALNAMDNRFHSVAQLEGDAGVPVLAAVAALDVRHLDLALKNAAKREGFKPANKEQEAWQPFLLFRPGVASTNYAETFRVLRASVSLLGDEHERKVTLISSALPGEGKSLISSNLALASAAQGRKTLLIDMDLRKPSLHRLFGHERDADGRPGTTEWFAGQASLDDAVLRDTGAENFHIMFSGKQAPNPGELLTAAKIRKLFDEVSSRYDAIIVDSAPILAVPDTRMIAPLADNFCLVVRAEYVPKGAVMRVLDLLESAGTPPSGLVFNGFQENRRNIDQNYSYGQYRLSRFGKAYQYGYGSYGSYGAYGADDHDAGSGKKSRRK